MCAQLFLIGVITAPVIKNIVSPIWCPIIMPKYYSYAHLIPNIGHYKWALVILGTQCPIIGHNKVIGHTLGTNVMPNWGASIPIV